MSILELITVAISSFQLVNALLLPLCNRLLWRKAAGLGFGVFWFGLVWFWVFFGFGGFGFFGGGGCLGFFLVCLFS